MDCASFDKLVLDHLPAMQRLAVRLTGDRDAAEDLMQDALFKAMRSRKTFEERASFSTWMTRIVINAFRDGVSKKGTGIYFVEPTGREIEKRFPSPFSAVQAADMADHVAGLVSALSPRQREVLVLIAYEQMSAAQTADALGMTEQNVRTTLHHARQKLREQLAPYLSPDQR